jgi:hypothetical protein
MNSSAIALYLSMSSRPMSSRLAWAILLVGGAAVFINGFIGRDLRSDVEMPLTEEEQADETPPSTVARLIAILFGLSLFIWGLINLLHDS